MVTPPKVNNKFFATLIIFGVVFILTCFLAYMVSCAPSAPPENSAITSEEKDPGYGMNEKLVDWTMQIDCTICHTTEAESVNNEKCRQALEHKEVACIECHTNEDVLKTSHEAITYTDMPSTKATVMTVPEQVCINCHGSMDEMAAVTENSTALTDSNNTSANPHELLTGEKHEANRPACTSCHNNHSEDLSKDAMKYCAQCHHRGVFTCGNCHEVR